MDDMHVLTLTTFVALFIPYCESCPVSTFPSHEMRDVEPILWQRGERVNSNAILPIQQVKA